MDIIRRNYLLVTPGRERVEGDSLYEMLMQWLAPWVTSLLQ